MVLIGIIILAIFYVQDNDYTGMLVGAVIGLLGAITALGLATLAIPCGTYTGDSDLLDRYSSNQVVQQFKQNFKDNPDENYYSYLKVEERIPHILNIAISPFAGLNQSLYIVNNTEVLEVEGVPKVELIDNLDVIKVGGRNFSIETLSDSAKERLVSGEKLKLKIVYDTESEKNSVMRLATISVLDE